MAIMRRFRRTIGRWGGRRARRWLFSKGPWRGRCQRPHSVGRRSLALDSWAFGLKCTGWHSSQILLARRALGELLGYFCPSFVSFGFADWLTACEDTPEFARVLLHAGTRSWSNGWKAKVNTPVTTSHAAPTSGDEAPRTEPIGNYLP